MTVECVCGGPGAALVERRLAGLPAALVVGVARHVDAAPVVRRLAVAAEHRDLEEPVAFVVPPPGLRDAEGVGGGAPEAS